MATTFAQDRAERFKELFDRTSKARLPWIPGFIIGLTIILAIFAPLIAPHDPRGQDLLNTRVAPFENPSYILGTDFVGRDVLSRVIHGARTSAFVSVVALGAGVAIGTVLGLVSGYTGRWVDSVIMRITDAVMGFPSLLVAMMIIVIMSAGITSIIIAVAATTWAGIARMIRGEVLAIRDKDFVTLAQIAGVSPPVIIWRHVFPNVVNTLMVMTSLLVGQVILLEASLSYLGLGLAPGEPAWGIMVAEGRQVLTQSWWISLFPGIAITIVVMAFNYLGDWLRDVLDPRLRRI